MKNDQGKSSMKLMPSDQLSKFSLRTLTTRSSKDNKVAGWLANLAFWTLGHHRAKKDSHYEPLINDITIRQGILLA
jgi:hypothetical protein